MKINKTYISSSLCQLVLEALKEFEFGAKRSELAEKLGDVSYGSLHYALMALLREGLVTRKHFGEKMCGRHSYYVYYLSGV